MAIDGVQVAAPGQPTTLIVAVFEVEGNAVKKASIAAAPNPQEEKLTAEPVPAFSKSDKSPPPMIVVRLEAPAMLTTLSLLQLGCEKSTVFPVSAVVGKFTEELWLI